MRRYGLIGKTLSHSFSPQYFKEKFEALDILDAEYKSYELPTIEDVTTLLESGIDGFNVTVPYKQAILPFLDELDEAAKKIGAVNCVVRINNAYKGFNTDWLGFKWSLLEFIKGKSSLKALVLGDGGASKGVCFALQDLGIEYTIVARNSDHLRYDQLDENSILKHPLIINTTSLGMYPDIASMPMIPYECLTANHFLYDIVYNPIKTSFLQEGEQKKTSIKNGYDMLRIQAEESWKIWANFKSV